MSKTRKNMGQICIILQKFITKQKTEIDDQKNYITKLSTLCGVTWTSLEIAYDCLWLIEKCGTDLNYFTESFYKKKTEIDDQKNYITKLSTLCGGFQDQYRNCL